MTERIKLNNKILNIISLYNNSEEVLEYAKKLESQTISNQISLVIVINMIEESTFSTFQKSIEKVKLDIKIYKPEKNLGYLNGAIYGYKEYFKSHIVPKWVVISNTDIEFNNENFFEDFLQDYYTEDTWLIGPSIYSTNKKSYDNPHYLERHTKKGLLRRMKIFSRPKFTYFYKTLSNIKSKLIHKKRQDSDFVYSVHGCFFFLNKRLMSILSRKEYGVEMYSEEAYISEIVLLNDKKCFYNSNIEIIHHESTVTSKLDYIKKINYSKDSLKYILDEFYLTKPSDIYVE